MVLLPCSRAATDLPPRFAFTQGISPPSNRVVSLGSGCPKFQRTCSKEKHANLCHRSFGPNCKRTIHHLNSMQSFTSPLGKFLRRLHLANRNLTFPQSLAVRQDVLAWCAGDPPGHRTVSDSESEDEGEVVRFGDPPVDVPNIAPLNGELPTGGAVGKAEDAVVKQEEGVVQIAEKREENLESIPAIYLADPPSAAPGIPPPPARFGKRLTDEQLARRNRREDKQMHEFARRRAIAIIKEQPDLKMTQEEMVERYGLPEVHLELDILFQDDDKRWDARGGVGYGYGVRQGKRRKVVNSE